MEKEEVYVDSRWNAALDLNVLMQQGLVNGWEVGTTRLKCPDQEHRVALNYLMVKPALFGITLYAAAHNRLEWWQAFGLKGCGALHDVDSPKLYGGSLDELIAATGCEPA